MKSSNYSEYFSVTEVADILSVSKETLERWNANGKLIPIHHPVSNYRVYHRDQLLVFDEARQMFNTRWDDEMKTKPKRKYTSIELFAGAGGLALGLEKAGFEHVALNEIMPDACDTLRKNRPQWNVLEGDVAQISFDQYKGKVDIVSGGFPCQAFSYAGKKLGFEDTRGTLFLSLPEWSRTCNPRFFSVKMSEVYLSMMMEEPWQQSKMSSANLDILL